MRYLVPFLSRALTVLLEIFMYDWASAEILPLNIPKQFHYESFEIHRKLSAFLIILSNLCTRYRVLKDPYVNPPTFIHALQVRGLKDLIKTSVSLNLGLDHMSK